jgi:hypothetical protein
MTQEQLLTPRKRTKRPLEGEGTGGKRVPSAESASSGRSQASGAESNISFKSTFSKVSDSYQSTTPNIAGMPAIAEILTRIMNLKYFITAGMVPEHLSLLH